MRGCLVPRVRSRVRSRLYLQELSRLHVLDARLLACTGGGSCCFFFFFSSRRRHTRFDCDWSSDVRSSDLAASRNRHDTGRYAFGCPVSATELERNDVRKRQRDRSRPGRLGGRRAARGARRRTAGRRRGARPALRARRGYSGRGPGPGPGTWLDLARQRRHAARGARPARAAFRAPPAADVHARARARTARRRLRRGYGRNPGSARARLRAGPAARPDALRARRRGAAALPRRRRDRLELPGHAAPGRIRALPFRRRAAGGTRPVDAANDRQRLRADRPDRARRLGDRRGPPRGDPRHSSRPGAALRRPSGSHARMKIVRTIGGLRAEPRDGSVGLVPTMGAFHEGHLALFRAARAENDLVVASLFVNPAQFGANEDLARYPRDEERDARVAEEAGVDVFFAPEVNELYPPGFQTWVEVEELGSRLEGEHRPGHFRGVATICLKLFNIVRPDRAYFGQKDAQQVAVVKRMVRDLDHEVQIRVVPTVRDADGLALSSRNAYLSPAERELALTLPCAPATKDAAQARARLDDVHVDYVEVADFEPRVLAAAVRVGKTRLIDNVVLDKEKA